MGGAHVEGGGETEYLPLTTAVTAWLDHAAQAIAAAPLQGGQAHSMRSLTSATPPVLGPTARAAEITNVASEQSVVQIAPAVHSAASSRLEESQHGTALLPAARSLMQQKAASPQERQRQLA